MNLSIQQRFSLWAGLSLLAIVLVTTLIVVIKFNAIKNELAEQNTRITGQQAEAYLDILASDTTSSILTPMEQALNSARTLAAAVTAIVENNTISDKRSLTLDLLERSLALSTDFLGSYVAFEPDRLDQADYQYANTAGSDAKGRFVPFVTRDGARYMTELLEGYEDQTLDENGVRTGEYYLCPKDTLNNCIVDPYLYHVDGSETLLTSMVVPIMARQRFIGIAGIDISADYLQEQVERVNQSLYDGAGVIRLFSPRGIITADSREPELVGQNIARVDPTLAAVVKQVVQTGQETRHIENGQMTVIKPFRPGASGHNWVTIIAVPEAIIYQSVAQQQQMLSEQQWQFITYISIAGLLLAIAGVFVVGMVAKSSIKPLHDMTGIVGSLADGEGDLTQRVTLGRKDETSALAGFLNHFITKLQSLIQGMMPIGQQLTALSTQGRNISEKTNQQMMQQRDLVDQMVSAVTEMAASAQQIAGNAERTAVLVNEANQTADAGGNLVKQNVDSINEVKSSVETSGQALAELLDSSAAITQILSEIQGIAEQTNLLALNAAIEAARAGDKGRGFAVVADEVRALAGRTQEATTEIQNRLKELNQCNRQASDAMQQSGQNVANAVELARSATDALDKIKQSINEVTEMTLQIASATEQQSYVCEDVSTNLTKVSVLTQQTAEGAQQLSQVGSELDQTAGDLQVRLSSFRV